MDTTVSEPINRPRLFRKGLAGETLFYPPFTPWRPIKVQSEEEKTDLLQKWTSVEKFQLVSLGIGGAAYVILKNQYLPGLACAAIAIIAVYATYLITVRSKYRHEYANPQNLGEKLGFVEYNRQMAETDSTRQLIFQLAIPLIAVAFFAWPPLPDEPDHWITLAIFLILLANQTLLLGLKLASSGKQPSGTD